MKRIDVEGGWYGEALPSGEYGVSVRDLGYVATHQGPISAPELIGLVVDKFKMAGQLHEGYQNVEWSGGAWVPVGASYGVNACCYDHLTGQLLQGAPQYGSQGIRYIDAAGIHTGDATYGRPGVIYEFTVRGDVTIGQGPESGAIAITPEGTFEIEPGDCRFVRFNRSGDQIAVTIVKLVEKKTVLKWFTRSEIASFPRLTPLDKQPGPINQENPPPMSNVNHLDIVQRFPKPDGSPAGNFAFIDAVRAACNDGAGFVKSSPGGDNTIAYGGGFVRTSRLVYPDGHLYKLLADAGHGGANTPEWADEGLADPGLFVAAVASAPTPAPTPVPTVPPFDPTPLVNAINFLGQSADALHKSITALENRVGVLESRPVPKWPLRVNGKTATSFGHQHQVNLIIEEIK